MIATNATTLTPPYASRGIQNWSRARFDDDRQRAHWSRNSGTFFDHRQP